MDHLERYFEEYRETNDPQKLMSALITCQLYEQKIPKWLVIEICAILEPMRYKRPARGRHSPAEAEAAFTRDVHRAYTVWRLRHDGVSEREVYQAAADELAGGEYEGSDEAIRQSWRRMKGRYLPPL